MQMDSSLDMSLTSLDSSFVTTTSLSPLKPTTSSVANTLKTTREQPVSKTILELPVSEITQEQSVSERIQEESVSESIQEIKEKSDSSERPTVVQPVSETIQEQPVSEIRRELGKEKSGPNEEPKTVESKTISASEVSTTVADELRKQRRALNRELLCDLMQMDSSLDMSLTSLDSSFVSTTSLSPLKPTTSSVESASKAVQVQPVSESTKEQPSETMKEQPMLNLKTKAQLQLVAFPNPPSLSEQRCLETASEHASEPGTGNSLAPYPEQSQAVLSQQKSSNTVEQCFSPPRNEQTELGEVQQQTETDSEQHFTVSGQQQHSIDNSEVCENVGPQSSESVQSIPLPPKTETKSPEKADSFPSEHIVHSVLNFAELLLDYCTASTTHPDPKPSEIAEPKPGTPKATGPAFSSGIEGMQPSASFSVTPPIVDEPKAEIGSNYSGMTAHNCADPRVVVASSDASVQTSTSTAGFQHSHLQTNLTTSNMPSTLPALVDGRSDSSLQSFSSIAQQTEPVMSSLWYPQTEPVVNSQSSYRYASQDTAIPSSDCLGFSAVNASGATGILSPPPLTVPMFANQSSYPDSSATPHFANVANSGAQQFAHSGYSTPYPHMPSTYLPSAGPVLYSHNMYHPRQHLPAAQGWDVYSGRPPLPRGMSMQSPSAPWMWPMGNLGPFPGRFNLASRFGHYLSQMVQGQRLMFAQPSPYMYTPRADYDSFPPDTDSTNPTPPF
jgi:hypothetical protein